ncbi:response regulator (plasmid) [Polymorphobacter sp. PAMC 29334]|uniref:CheR family methyltransferase n=1 Tax=Polymorphobacter sp. PAMC 29334 TaxID=2862331 RepID=UPI001C77836F|nr:CheR family methyltransferase [Polymorphobacter sp. PAMC 29334]QYE33496.1 response regulator [Polymorphobacter sp. PAMC 29334]
MSRSQSAAADTAASSLASLLIVAVGASAGGLDACTRLVEAVPDGTGMAFVVVQHLEPTHKSMMVDLLGSHTAMTVVEAVDGMRVERDHIYLIPPGTYLAVIRGRLKLSPPTVRHGARMPFDFLLNALAADPSSRCAAIILSGTGSDGSLGLQAIRASGGLIIAQDPGEAAYDGMPQSAIDTGDVDRVLRVADMPAALAQFQAAMPNTRSAEPADNLAAIISLLRSGTAHDFTQYKPGTIARRIDRRMAMLGMPSGDRSAYLDVLSREAGELDQLGKDLLINVTSFFRDAKVFETLAKTVVPALVRDQRPGQPLRIWIAGCSSGEEAYSIAILFHEEIARSKRSLKLQIFASDLDEDAVATARDGRYPAAISSTVSSARLARFFVKGDDDCYTVTPALRSDVVFTVQNVLADPPFSRLDMISCRNLLIYLDPEAQQKVVALFAFALRDNGVLVLGNAETTGSTETLFTVTSKSDRIYERLQRAGPRNEPTGARAAPLPIIADRSALTRSRHNILADLCRRLVLEAHAPAAVLVNRRFECLYSLGPTERYLRVPPGHPTQDILAMAPHGLRARLRAAIDQVGRDVQRHVVTGCRTTYDGHPLHYSLDLRSVMCGGEELILIAFIDVSAERAFDMPDKPPRLIGADQLDSELATVRSELEAMTRSFEIAEEERKATSEEASSVNEEFQSTNEELLTSKEELQSLNEELTALNAQLQETLDRQRTTADDLQNILYSTDVATLFLDHDLNIRFFTPATKALFNVIPGDVGRPLADLRSLAADPHLPADARAVLKTGEAVDREVADSTRLWCRTIQPYRVQGGGVEGVVITFADITDRIHVAEALEAAKHQAELANRAKSSFLAAASHDLRQPLQTLKLLEGLLEKSVEGEKPKDLVERFGQTLATMAQMLDRLLDINQIEAGTVTARFERFPVMRVLDTLRDEFGLHAQAKDLELRVVPCSLEIDSDPRLLEQMLRNLLNNALKYTSSGKILIGCRRHADRLSIQICDTGIGIAADDLDTIFEEYRQLASGFYSRDHGLGLGLSIVQRLGRLLGHSVKVASQIGSGSTFSIDIACTSLEVIRPAEPIEPSAPRGGETTIGTIFVIEDDDSVRETNELVLQDAGYATVAAADGAEILRLALKSVVPSLILTDFNLPNDMDGLAVAAALRKRFARSIPTIVLTGDISTASLRAIAEQDCVHLSKPVKLKELLAAIASALTPAAAAIARPAFDLTNAPVIFVVDDDDQIRTLLRVMLEDEGLAVEDFASAEDFIAAYRPGREDCLLVDAYLPGMNGLDLLRTLGNAGHRIPSIMITGSGDVTMAVQAMKAGALDFIEKPVGTAELLVGVARALEQSRDAGKLFAWRRSAADHVGLLTSRQHQIMDLVLAGHPSKNIAADLEISQRTVENHRAAIMKKTGSKSVPELARLALSAASVGSGGVLIASSMKVPAVPAE